MLKSAKLGIIATGKGDFYESMISINGILESGIQYQHLK